jgi:DNA invertase Pin-like site-specific DNA recombinase
MQTNNNQKPYEYRQNERRTSYTVNPDEAALVRQIYTRVGSQENQGTAIYARSAAGENAALAVQIDQCMRYAEEYGYTVNDQHVYQEVKAGSADPLQHKQFARLFEAAKRQKFTVLLVTHLDRLSRNSSAAMRVVRKLQELGIRVIETHQ